MSCHCRILLFEERLHPSRRQCRAFVYQLPNRTTPTPRIDSLVQCHPNHRQDSVTPQGLSFVAVFAHAPTPASKARDRIVRPKRIGQRRDQEFTCRLLYHSRPVNRLQFPIRGDNEHRLPLRPGFSSLTNVRISQRRTNKYNDLRPIAYPKEFMRQPWVWLPRENLLPRRQHQSSSQFSIPKD